MTARSIWLGLILVSLLAILVPINDWHYRTTFFYSQHLPIGVLLLVVIVGVVINPLLGRFRLKKKELLVITAMLFVLGGVVSSGLNRIFSTTMSGPARKLASGSELNAFVTEGGDITLPRGPYIGIEDGKVPDSSDPEYRYLIDGYWNGLGVEHPSVGHRSTVTWRDEQGVERTQEARTGTIPPGMLDLDHDPGLDVRGRRAGQKIATAHGELEVLDVQPPPVPWGRWFVALLHWIPVILPALVCFLSLGAIVRRQWLEHERLPYPIAGVVSDFLEEPVPGRRMAELFRQRGFWIAFSLVVIVLLSQLLNSFGLNPLPIPTSLHLTQTFAGDPWTKVWHHGQLFTWRVYFSIVALTFLLPPGMSFSLWAGWVVMNVVPGFLRASGIPVAWNETAQVAVGGYMVMCLLIIWIGRVFYGRVLMTAFGLRRDPTLRDEVIFAWAFILGFAGMVGGMMYYGAYMHHAMIAACVYLGTGLVLARFVAEAGIPYINSPTYWTNAPVIFSLTGVGAPLAALVPLGMLAQTLCADPREHILGFAVNAEAMAARAGAKRWPITGIFLLVSGIGTVLALGAMLLVGYWGGNLSTVDPFWSSALMGGFDLPARGSLGNDPFADTHVYVCYAIGAIATAGLGLARLAWSWFPLHPIGILVAPTWATGMIWFSFFVGWLWKAGVMRYGGIRVYRLLRPVAMGLIAGEAVMVGVTLIIGLIGGIFDIDIPQMPKFLPW
jgi:hypothetical protein